MDIPCSLSIFDLSRQFNRNKRVALISLNSIFGRLTTKAFCFFDRFRRVYICQMDRRDLSVISEHDFH